MFCQIEDLPYKNIINFHVPDVLTNTALFYRSSDAPQSILFRNIMQIPGIVSCLAADKLLSVTYDKIQNKDIVRALILAELDENLTDEYTMPDKQKNLDLKILSEAIADALIRPILNQDKGDINITSVKNNIMEIEFVGNCANCPYAQRTLQNTVLSVFRHYLPQIEQYKLKR